MNSMGTNRRLRLAAALASVGVSVVFLLSVVSASPTSTISGLVSGLDGTPVAGAIVRIQATNNSTTTAADGLFTLSGLTDGVAVTVSAWKDKYYCAKVEGVVPPASDTVLVLRLYQADDNPEYEWIPPIGSDSCATCKPRVTDIWMQNAHAGAGTNPRFLSLYNGTDITGDEFVAPGYVQDFPGTTGNCAACHAPGAAVNGPFSTDMNTLAGADKFGVHCDLCHKVADVYVNPATGLPYENAPGVFSMDVRRPFPETDRYQLFFGTFDDDNVPEEDTYLPLIAKSQFCAPCHQFSMWGTPIYQSFGEWLESPYPQLGVECQTCHMPPDGIMTNVAPGTGGVERDPMTIHAHTQPGASDEELLQNTVEMTLAGQQVADRLRVSVAITNTGAGHHVPTDHPARHMILLVTVRGGHGEPLPLRGGPSVAAWGGEHAGQPGKTFAKVLKDVETGASPVVSYWKQTLIESDNRIPAFGTDVSTYDFALPEDAGRVDVEAVLLFRRAFQSLVDQRGWDPGEIVMESADLSFSTRDVSKTYLPAVQR